MLKKLLVAIISMNICFSGLAYAQYQPQEGLTEEAAEIYMKTIEKREEGLPEWIAIGGGVGVLLALRYSVKKIAVNPELSQRFFASIVSFDPQNPERTYKAYQTIMEAAEKKAATELQKAAIREAAAKEAQAMARWEAAMRHSGRIKAIRRANYWKAVISRVFDGSSSVKEAVSQMKRAESLLAEPVTSNTNKLVSRVKKARGKLAILTIVGVFIYSYFHDNNKEEAAIINNREPLERKIKELMEKDIDSLALYVYSLTEEQKKVAYSILADNPEIFEIIKQQVEAALSEDNIELAKKVYEISEDSEKEEDLLRKKNELIDSLRQSEENFAPAWSFGE